MKNLHLVLLVPLLLVIEEHVFAQEKVSFKEIMGLSAAELAGFVKYDPEEVLKKMKFERKGEWDRVAYLFHNYNAQMDSLAYVNRLPLISISTEYEMTSDRAVETGNYKPLVEFYEFVNLSTSSMKEEAEKIETNLNSSLSLFLSESQYHHWILYQKKVKKKLKPRLPMPMSGPIV